MKRLFVFIHCLLVATLMVGVVAMPLLAAESAAEKTDAAQPIHIEADRMESFERKSEVLFSGQVEATQGGIVLHADEMLVSYRQPEGEETGNVPQSRKIDKIFAKGNVKLVSDVGWVATGATMDYLAVARKAILTGDAKVWKDNNLVTGNKIILFLDEGKSVVESDPEQGQKRVKALLYPGSEKEKKNGE
ncbi:MAG: lipopolysaccharide transport periplasmic protein LptA [Desulfobulbaceae bacterium]|nr:lipopolysaccharide transport periplasmic protein LptA [Desulfobulbaceae bacterium]